MMVLWQLAISAHSIQLTCMYWECCQCDIIYPVCPAEEEKTQILVRFLESLVLIDRMIIITFEILDGLKT